MARTSSKIVIALLLIILFCGAAFVGFKFLTSPTIITARSVKNAVSDFTDRDEIAPWLKVLKKGSVEVSLSNIVEDGEAIPGKLHGKLYFSQKDKSVMLDDFSLNVNNGINLQGSAYISAEEAYVEEDYILNGAYGARYEDLAKELSKSIFAPSSGSKYALDQDVYDKLMSLLDGIEESESEEFVKDAKKLSKTIFKDIMKIIEENAETESRMKKERILGEKSKVRVTTILIESDEMDDIMDDVLHYLYNSRKLEDFIDEYEDILISLFISDVDEFEREYSSFYKYFEDELNDAYDDLENNDRSKNYSLEIKIVTPRLSTKLLKLEINENDKTKFSVDFGKKGVAKTDEIEIKNSYSTWTYEVLENDSKSAEYRLTTRGDYSDTEYTLSIDKKRGTYEAVEKYTSRGVYSNYSYKHTYKGEVSIEKNETSFTIDTINYSWSNNDSSSSSSTRLDCEVTIKQRDQMPDPLTEYKSISDITITNVESWINKVSSWY